MTKSLSRFRRTFSDVQEAELVDYLHKMESYFYGLTKGVLKSQTYQMAVRNHLQHQFKNEKARDQWVADFMRRHQSLSLRTPETTSTARSQGFNRVSVSRFFTLLREQFEKHHFKVDDIYNVDETAVKTSASKPPKIIAHTGKRQVGVISSLEKGALITSLVCCSATGQFIPPALIFPRKRLPLALLSSSLVAQVLSHRSTCKLEKGGFSAKYVLVGATKTAPEWKLHVDFSVIFAAKIALTRVQQLMCTVLFSSLNSTFSMPS